MARVDAEDLEDFFDEGVDDIAEEMSDDLADGLEEGDIIEGEAVDLNDESDEEPSGETVKEDTSTQKAAVAEKKKAEVGSSNLGFDFSALGALPGVVVGETGLEVSRFPVEKTKFSKGQRALISILSDQVVVAKVHYDEEHGSFLCFGGACCQNDLARVRYVYPVMQYETNNKGKPISKEVKNKCLCIGADTYQALLDIKELKGDLTQFDLLVSCTDEQYQAITLQEAGLARYKKSPKMVREIQEFWAENSKHILKAVARKITPEQYAKASAAEATTANELDFDEVFD